jgi:4-hydroxybenzoate polyprenyltransferase
MESLKNWMVDAANILFDDSKNDLRSLPRSVRLQILLVLSFIWTTVFSLYIFSYTTFAFGWAGLYIAHIGLIFAVYMTFKHFHKQKKNLTVFLKQKILIPLK